MVAAPEVQAVEARTPLPSPDISIWRFRSVAAVPAGSVTSPDLSLFWIAAGWA